METKTIHLWASGESVTYAGEWQRQDAALLVFPKDWQHRDTKSRVATAEEARAIRIEERARMYASAYVWCNDSGMVTDAMQLAYEDSSEFAREFSDDNVANLLPDVDGMDAGEMREYIEERGGTLPDVPDGECEQCQGDDSETCETCDGTGETPMAFEDADDDDEYLDALRDAVRDCAEPQEVYQWFRVDPWLASQLKSIGEPVLDNAYGEWWGRTCCGQALIMDGTLQRIAANFERGVSA